MKRVRILFALLLIVPLLHAEDPKPAKSNDFVGFPALTLAEDAVPKTRREFAAAMATIKAGMSEKGVLSLLGKPDDIQTADDLGGFSIVGTAEIWRYGTDRHLGLGTLGCISIDPDRRVQYTVGGQGEPPDPKLLPEEELRSLLRLIYKAPSFLGGDSYNPLTVIQIVNALQPLGKDKALAAISEYCRVTGILQGNSGRQGVCLVLRVLFDVPADTGFMPPLWPPALSKDPKRFPRLPILLQDDLPLFLKSGPSGIRGMLPGPESDLAYFREKGRLREKPLMPGKSPLGVMDSWATNAGGVYEDISDGKHRIRNQLLGLISSVYRRPRGWDWTRTGFGENADEEWKSIEKHVAALDIRWNAATSRYTLKDGSYIPDTLIGKDYQLYKWKLKDMNDKAEVLVERVGPKHIEVTLIWYGKKGQKVPEFTMDLLDVKDKTNPLVKIWPAKSGFTFLGEASSSDAFHVELAEGAEVQVKLKLQKSELLSPVYKP